MSKGLLREQAEPAFDVIGEEHPRVDSWEKVTGEAEYAGDLDRSRLAHAVLKRSTAAHAYLEGIDTSAAEAMDGVLAVMTGEDFPVTFGSLPAGQDEHPLAQEKVRYVGEPVAAVAAVDEETARQAADRIEVSYDPLEPYTSIEGALEEADEPVHDKGYGNSDRVAALEFGDVDAAFEEAAHVREDVFFYEGNTHVPLETHSALAQWERGRERIHLWASTQCPHTVHRVLADALDLPERKVHVHANTIGGGFGGKVDVFPHQLVVAKLSQLLERPVAITLTREEVFYTHRGRHPVLMWIKSGVDEDGRLLATDFKSFLDGGAYASLGAATTYYTGALQALTYRLPNYRFRGMRLNTNKPPCGPKRGHGAPQPRYAQELHMTRLADDLGLDPVELRRRNFTGPDEVTTNYLEITTNGLAECVERVLEASGWAEKRGSLPEGRGVGFAVSSFYSGAGEPTYWNDMPHSEVQIKVDRSGAITAFSGAAEVGQGSDSILADIVAEVFGQRPEDINLVVADSDETPVDLGSYASRVTLMMGNAARDAAEKALQPILEAAADELDVPSDELVAEDYRVYPEGDPEAGLDFEDAVELAENEQGLVGAVGNYTPPEKLGDFPGSGVGPSPAYSFSATVVEVDVDTETGEVDVEQVWMAHDVGRALNPMSVEGQVEGSVYMGLSEAMLEEQTFFDDGLHRKPNLLDYKTLTPQQMPDVESLLVETDDPRGPFGAKEAGQGPLLPIPPAFADAIDDAVGVRIDETPVTPRKVLQALDGRHVGPEDVPDADYPDATHVEVPDDAKQGLR
ncbi:MAG: molybdopterin cofactor-binding domain-containing protein [Halobacteriales archaeon]